MTDKLVATPPLTAVCTHHMSCQTPQPQSGLQPAAGHQAPHKLHHHHHHQYYYSTKKQIHKLLLLLLLQNVLL